MKTDKVAVALEGCLDRRGFPVMPGDIVNWCSRPYAVIDASYGTLWLESHARPDEVEVLEVPARGCEIMALSPGRVPPPGFFDNLTQAEDEP